MAAQKFQAGTPDVAGPVGLAAAVRFFEAAGPLLRRHDDELVRHGLGRLAEIPRRANYWPPWSRPPRACFHLRRGGPRRPRQSPAHWTRVALPSGPAIWPLSRS